jgi:putative flavoprotein involved in K+ transport
MPSIADAEGFAGEQRHSSIHPGADAYRGNHCVLVGAYNSAHDIAAALWEAGAAELAMIQRSSTVVASLPALERLLFADSYSEQALDRGITH